jgi:hypothetical protein
LNIAQNRKKTKSAIFQCSGIKYRYLISLQAFRLKGSRDFGEKSGRINGGMESFYWLVCGGKKLSYNKIAEYVFYKQYH